MSKKKATMTLKDFHGGCIPSDLPLPSAPGVTRGGFDQTTSWGNSIGRADHRLRPASAGSARNLDEKTPFLTHSTCIGRNFDEDERKPLDGGSGPRRTVGDESLHSQSRSLRAHKTDNQSRVGTRPVSVPVYQTSSSTGNSYAGKAGGSNSVMLNNQTFNDGHGSGSNYPIRQGSAGQAMGGTHPNAWGVRKQMASTKEPVSAPWSAPDAATKLAHASALEKVSSGRWSLNVPARPLKNSEALGRQEGEGELMYNSNISSSKMTYNRLDVVGDSDPDDVVLAMHAERSLVVGDGSYGGGKESRTYEKAKPDVHADAHLRNSSISGNGSQSLQPTGKPGGSDLHPALPSVSSERPKLKLLPRSKPLENMDMAVDYKQVSEEKTDLVEDNFVTQEPKNNVQSGFTGSEIVERASERPKLNLKPRTQSLEQPDGNDENKRGTVFGAARPREVVLKERGVDDDVRPFDGQSPLRIKEGTTKGETFMHTTPARYHDKSDNAPTEQKLQKYPDRRSHQHEGERIDQQRKNRPNEIRRNNRDNTEKHHNQQQKQAQDWPPSPETWRKPIEQPREASLIAVPPPRHGKAASAVELAQAFSKSVFNPSTVLDRFSGPRGIPNRGNQVPFSRLVGPEPRPQINGY